MTLKYESEILFDLMKRDGDDTPSDVLPYESELKEKYLEQVEGAYPKLMDYRPEWLNYNLVAHLPADFPVETLSNVTRATVDNVVPYAYGSASLKGQTLFNIPSKNFSETAKELSSWVVCYDETFTLKPNTKYYIGIFNYSTESKLYGVRVDPFTDGQKVTIQPNGYGYLIATTVASITSNALVVNKAPHTQKNNAKFLFIEYQEGMENWNIPYFEGMQSVQMPGLTTTGKNLVDNKKFQTRMNATITDVQDNSITFDTKDVWAGLIQDVTLIPNTQYTLSCILSTNTIKPYIRHVLADGSLTGAEGGNNAFSFTTNETGKISISFENGDTNNPNKTGLTVSNVQLEKGTTATSSEAYQSNILTVNEPIELRGIDEVKDELNLLTGELTQRIGEVVLDGSERWYGTAENYRVEIPNVKGYKDLKWGQKSAICSLYPPYEGTETDCYIISEWEGNQIRIRDVNTTLEELKTKLAKNPLHVIFILNEESGKTLDLTITDQDGNSESVIRPLEGTMHLMMEGDTIKPLFSGEIPVEATTQNLMSFVNMEREE